MTTLQRLVDFTASLAILGVLAWFLVDRSVLSPAGIASFLSNNPSNPRRGEESKRAGIVSASPIKTRPASTPIRPRVGSIDLPLASNNLQGQVARQGNARLISPKTLASLLVNPMVGLVNRPIFLHRLVLARLPIPCRTRIT
jgi:hypothetical protein